jgi:hypothetical protein
MEADNAIGDLRMDMKTMRSMRKTLISAIALALLPLTAEALESKVVGTVDFDAALKAPPELLVAQVLGQPVRPRYSLEYNDGADRVGVLDVSALIELRRALEKCDILAPTTPIAATYRTDALVSVGFYDDGILRQGLRTPLRSSRRVCEAVPACRCA